MRAGYVTCDRELEHRGETDWSEANLVRSSVCVAGVADTKTQSQIFYALVHILRNELVLMKCITETSVYSVSFIKIRQILAQPRFEHYHGV